jgi:DNA mismatch repair protein MutS
MYRPGTKKLTPVMRQYRDAKQAFPDAILFFRLGDFYEMFNEDAEIAARELSLTLTARNKKSGAEPVPMAGVPYHTAHNYLAKLIARGHKVAICEQMGDPSKIKGIVPRKVVRVLTPGLLTDSDQLDASRNNFLCAVDGANAGDETAGARLGLSLLDLSTGDLLACTVGSTAVLVAEIARADPAETLVPDELAELEPALRQAAPNTAVRHDAALAEDDVRRHLDESVETPLHDAASAEHELPALRAAARALRFATHYLPDHTLPVRRIAHHDPSASMHIDETAQQHLELVRGAQGSRDGSLLSVIDVTVTAGGARRLRRQLLAPLTEVAAIRRRLDAVELFVTNPRSREELREILRGVGDVERLAIRASLREASPRDLKSLHRSLVAAPDAAEVIRSIAHQMATDEPLLDVDIGLLPDLADLLGRALVDEPPAHAREGGMIARGFDTELDEIAELREGSTKLISEMEQRLREETDIPSLKVKFTRAFGWYIEVTKANVDKVPESWRRRQTLTNAERYVDDALSDLAEKLTNAEERYHDRESEIFASLIEEAAAESEPLRRLARAIAQWDVSSALAEVAHEHDFSRPAIDESSTLKLADARHPVVEQFVPRGQFVPNDTELDLEGEFLWLITGPNMAGKSTLMRQVALNVILAQMGSFIPAREAHIGIVDRVLSRVGASDNLARGESTFMVEMRETAAILRHATRRSLVILDEIGRGTSTFDGLAIAWAVTEHLHETVRARAMFATHYHQLTELGEMHAGIANYSVSAREHEGDIVFLHRIQRGSVSRSYGIAVARLAGLPESVLSRAGAVLASLENEAPIAGGPGKLASAAEPQLSLFAPPSQATCSDEEHAALEQLRNVDTNRLTPLEALSLLDNLKKQVTSSDS